MTDIDDVTGPIDDVDVPEIDEDNGNDTDLTSVEDEHPMTDHTTDGDGLTVSDDDVKVLSEKASGVERIEDKSNIHFGNQEREYSLDIKKCPTSHGCSGATSCDSCIGDYHP